MGDRRGHGSRASMTPDHPRYKWWMVLTVVPAGLISAIDGTSVGIAIPSMLKPRHDLRYPSASLS
ncbi:MAG TPA: hypothetical protein VI542_29430 [Candidatus Tectomicrobia bacterium]